MGGSNCWPAWLTLRPTTGPWVDPLQHLPILGPTWACEGTSFMEQYLQDFQDTGYPRRAPVIVQWGFSEVWCIKTQRPWTRPRTHAMKNCYSSWWTTGYTIWHTKASNATRRVRREEETDFSFLCGFYSGLVYCLLLLLMLLFSCLLCFVSN